MEMNGYLVWAPELDQTRDDAEVIAGSNPLDAASKWVERWDKSDDNAANGMGPVALGGALEVMVAEHKPDSIGKPFRVAADVAVIYIAEEVRDAAGGFLVVGGGDVGG